MSSLTVLPVQNCCMGRDTVIPDDDSARGPLNPCLQILCKGNMVIQELEKIVALLFLESFDMTSELLVHEQGLLTSYRVCSNNWVGSGTGLATDNGSAGTSSRGLFVARMYGFQSVESLLELWRQAIIRLSHVHERGVTTSCRSIKNI